jgi:predicted transcriptional regulator
MSWAFTFNVPALGDVHQLVERLKTGSLHGSLKAISEFCIQCKAGSPLLCVEFCALWEVKRRHIDQLRGYAEGPTPQEVVNALKTKRRFAILRTLAPQALRVPELTRRLNDSGHTIRPRDVEDLLAQLTRYRLVTDEGDAYHLSAAGSTIVAALDGVLAALPRRSKGREEAVLLALDEGAKTRKDLGNSVPRHDLAPTLRRLVAQQLVTRSEPAARVLYFTAKRRPTRKLTPTELRIFKALPKHGLSATELSDAVGINRRRVYRYLRRLIIRRHVVKRVVTPTYHLTETGRRLAGGLRVVHDLCQREVPPALVD